MELSDDSDIEVHPNVDKRSFIRAKQSQIHAERQQRKLQIEALKYEDVVNKALLQRVAALLTALKSRLADSHTHNPAEIAFQAVIETTPHNSEEDRPPPRPEGVFSTEEPLPTYTKMMMGILDEVRKKLDEKHVPQDKRYEAIMEEINAHFQAIEKSQEDSNQKLAALEKKNAVKITSESYRTGFDSSHVNKAKSGESSKQESKPELLNPGCEVQSTDSKSIAKRLADGLDEGTEKIRASPAAKEFAQIPPSDYRASREFLSSHPEIIRESETDGLLLEAYNIAFDQNDSRLTRQYVHQALVLRYCCLLGRDGVSLLFKRITSPEHQARGIFEKDVADSFKRIIETVAEQRAAQGDGAVEQIQIQSVETDAAIQIHIPPEASGDKEVRAARAIFESFPSEMRAALESGSLAEVNKVLGMMDISEAENMVGLLGDVSAFRNNPLLSIR